MTVKKKTITRILCIPVTFTCLLLGFDPAHADVRLHGLFTDNMVLQQGMHVPVWGRADPGENITVSLADSTTATKADNRGAWMVNLGPLAADNRILTLTVSGKTEIILNNVVVGEVWLASGQSNMDMELAPSTRYSWRKGVLDFEQTVADANHSLFRFFTVPGKIAPNPLGTCTGRWSVCTPDTIGEFSAVAYFFGRKIRTELDVPVGIIKSSFGGSRIESWMSLSALSQAGFKALVEEWIQFVNNYDHPKETANYEKRLKKYNQLRAQGTPAPKPLPPAPPSKNINGPAQLYNAMIAPLSPFALRGVIWYQGESNTGNAADYCTLFPALIQSWRTSWNQGAFPFLFVQLANYDDPKTPSHDWPGVREAQRHALRIPNTAMVVTIDVGDAGDIHPRNKKPVGERLARAAQALAYNTELVYQGPSYRSMTIAGDTTILHFDNASGGLVADGNQSLQGFEIAGKDKTFHPAEATIDGESIVVRSNRVPQPVAVRYAWDDDPIATILRNNQGLPASPFTTEEWCLGN